MSEIFFVTYNDSGVITGGGYSPDGTLPPNALPCSRDIAGNYKGWIIQAGALVYKPTPILYGPADAAQYFINKGLTITSNSTPAINGTYPLDANTTAEIASVTLFIQVNGDFPGGSSSYPWYDIDGGIHVFPNTTVFTAWATLIANYVAMLKLYGAGTPGVVLPSSSLNIP